MKRTSLYVISLLAVLFVGINTAYAIDLAGIQSQNRTDMNVTNTDNVSTVKLLSNTDAGLEVRANQTVVLDLNGHNLTNYCYGNNTPTNCTGASAVIEVEKGGKLTITDSSTSTVGTVTQKASTKGMVAIDNKGTLIIEKGNITGIASVGTAENAYSVILNQGTMEVKGGTITSSDGNKAAAIHNLGTITISDGEIKTGVEESWGLLNYGTATISGGTFSQGYKYSVIQNSGDMTIAGGDFKTTGGGVHYALITNENVYNTSNKGNATLKINNGKFESNIVLSYGTSGKGEAVINGGTFDTTQNLGSFIAPDSELGEDGKIVKKAVHDVTVADVENAVVEVDKESTYEGDTVTVTVKPEDGYKVDEIIVKTADGTAVEVKDGKFVMPDEDVTVDVKLVEIVAEVEPDTELEENPNTLDKAPAYLAVGAVALTGLVALGYSIKKKFEN